MHMLSDELRTRVIMRNADRFFAGSFATKKAHFPREAEEHPPS